jgi:hypothetical protein
MLTSDPSASYVYYAEDRLDSLKLFARSTPTNFYWGPKTPSSTLYIQVRKQGFRSSNWVTIPANKIPPGYHFILATLSDSTSQPIDPLPSQTTLGTQNFGYIKFTASEAYVDIYINNELRGQITKDEPFVKKLPAGNYLITARKEFFKPVSIKFNLYENDVFPYHFDLQRVSGYNEEPPGRSSIVQARGNLTVVTEKSNFKVMFEGQPKVPPFQLRDLPAGRYVLLVSRLGLEKTIVAIVNDKETCIVDLDKEFSK